MWSLKGLSNRFVKFNMSSSSNIQNCDVIFVIVMRSSFEVASNLMWVLWRNLCDMADACRINLIAVVVLSMRIVEGFWDTPVFEVSSQDILSITENTCALRLLPC